MILHASFLNSIYLLHVDLFLFFPAASWALVNATGFRSDKSDIKPVVVSAGVQAYFSLSILILLDYLSAYCDNGICRFWQWVSVRIPVISFLRP